MHNYTYKMGGADEHDPLKLGFVPRFIHDRINGRRSSPELAIIGRGAMAHPVAADEWNSYLMAAGLCQLLPLMVRGANYVN